MAQREDQHKPEEEKKREEGFWQTYRDFAPFLTLGFQLAAAVILFFFIGYWLDRHFETSPTYTLVGLFLGVVGGFIKFFKTVSTLGKNKES